MERFWRLFPIFQKYFENADFFEKLSKEFGGGGSGGGGNNINMQQAGAALVAMGVLYYLYQNVSI